MNDELTASIAARRAILFVGAGVSSTLGTPSWKQLIAHMAKELNYDPRLLAPAGASFLTVGEYFRVKLEDAGIRKLAEKMRAEWNASDTALRQSTVYRAIHDLAFPIHYTTNYDQNLENALRVFGGTPTVVTEVASFPALPSAEQVVVKFHGDVDDPQSLVLTEQDYFRRLDFENPLDIRLRSDALSHALLFIGYSLADINIRLLLYKLTKMWHGTSGAARPRSFVLLQRPNEMERTVLGSWGVEVLTHDVDDPQNTLSSFLVELCKQVATLRSLSCSRTLP